MAEGGGLLNRCRAFKVLPRVRIPPSPPAFAHETRGSRRSPAGAEADSPAFVDHFLELRLGLSPFGASA